jgi:hypothetical protein
MEWWSEISKLLEHHNVDYLGVAFADEVSLKKGYSTKPNQNYYQQLPVPIPRTKYIV